MNSRRRWLGVGVLGGLVYAGGGYDGGALSSVECHDPTTNAWSFVASMNQKRHSCGVAVTNGFLYVVGGSAWHSLSSMERYDPVANTWTLVAPLPRANYRDCAQWTSVCYWWDLW